MLWELGLKCMLWALLGRKLNQVSSDQPDQQLKKAGIILEGKINDPGVSGKKKTVVIAKTKSSQTARPTTEGKSLERPFASASQTFWVIF